MRLEPIGWRNQTIFTYQALLLRRLWFLDFMHSKKIHKKTHSDKSDKNRLVKFEHVKNSGVQEPYKLLEFIQWLALPKDFRKPKTQKEFAKGIGVNQDTLSDWKKLPDFWKEVNLYHRSHFRSHTADVLNGLLQQAKTGRAAEVRLFLEYFEGYFGREVIIQDSSSLTPEQEERISIAIRNWFGKRYASKTKA
jgi:hypothetical protein